MQHDESRFHLIWTPLIKQHQGKTLQAVGLVCPKAPGKTDRFTMTFAGRTHAALGSDLLRYPGTRDAQGVTCLWLVPRPVKAAVCKVAWRSASGGREEAKVMIAPARALNVHVEVDADSGSCVSIDAARADLLGIEAISRMIANGRTATSRPGRSDTFAASLAGSFPHTASLAMALVAAGGSLLHVHADCNGESKQELPPVFWWNLPDRQRILCCQSDRSLAALFPPAGYSHKHWLAAGSSPAAAKTLSEQVRWIADHFDGPTIRTGGVKGFVEAMRRDHGTKLPTVKGELVDALQPAVIRDSGNARRRREEEERTAAEITHAILERGTAKAKPAVRASSKSSAARSVPAHSEMGILLVNVAGWPRGGLVQMNVKDLPVGEFELIDPTTGGIVVHHRHEDQLTFIAPPVPACGSLRLDVKPVKHRQIPGPQADWNERHLSLHFESYVLQFHTAGGMCRWHDRSRSMQWCSNKVDFPMGTCLTQLADGKLVGGGKATVTPHIGPFRSQVVVEADCAASRGKRTPSGGTGRYRTTYTLYRGQRDLHVRMELLGQARAREAGYGFFPLYGEEPFILIDRIAHLVEPHQDLYGKSKPTCMGVRGVRVECQHAGVNFYPLDTPTLCFGQPAGRPVDGKRAYKDGVMYAALTGQARSYEFVLRPTGNDEWDGGLARGGLELLRPIQGVVVRGRCDMPARSLVRVEPDLVHLVALKPAERTKGLMLRLWSADPDPVMAKLTFPETGRGCSLVACDLLEKSPARARPDNIYVTPGTRIPIDRQGRALVPMRPHEIVTLMLADDGCR